MAKYNSHRSLQEWLQLIIECRQSGMADNAWCERHNIPLSSFYNAITRLRKKACAIPESTAPWNPEVKALLDCRVDEELVKS